jgi:hypothetical protein
MLIDPPSWRLTSVCKLALEVGRNDASAQYVPVDGTKA